MPDGASMLTTALLDGTLLLLVFVGLCFFGASDSLLTYENLVEVHGHSKISGLCA